MKQYKVLFCDLDGTLIETLSGKTFPKGIWDMKLKFDVLDAIKKLNPEFICIVTNQGGIEKGFVNKPCWISKITYICACIAEYVDFNSHTWYQYCPFNNKDHIMRKPNVGMLQGFMDIYREYDKSDCLMIGDASGKEGQFSDTDKKTAENFGIDYIDVADFVNQTLYRDKISALLMDTDEEHHISVHIPLELKENQGLSTNDMLTVEEIWQHPTEGIIMLKIRGIGEPVELETYEECLEQIYKYLLNNTFH